MSMQGCPHCGKAAVVEIVYGLPGPDAAARAERGEVILAGCVVSEGGPTTDVAGAGRSGPSPKMQGELHETDDPQRGRQAGRDRHRGRRVSPITTEEIQLLLDVFADDPVYVAHPVYWESYPPYGLGWH